MITNDIRVAFFNDAGEPVADMLGPVGQVWSNAGLFGWNVRIISGTEWAAMRVEDLPNMSEIPENSNA